jgi:gamma-glutamyltranspeptidase
VPAEIQPEFDQIRTWQAQNLYFGGVHAVWRGPDILQAAGDPRRGGAAIVL